MLALEELGHCQNDIPNEVAVCTRKLVFVEFVPMVKAVVVVDYGDSAVEQRVFELLFVDHEQSLQLGSVVEPVEQHFGTAFVIRLEIDTKSRRA